MEEAGPLFENFKTIFYLKILSLERSLLDRSNFEQF
jgi:hypothetical protein